MGGAQLSREERKEAKRADAGRTCHLPVKTVRDEDPVGPFCQQEVHQKKRALFDKLFHYCPDSV